MERLLDVGHSVLFTGTTGVGKVRPVTVYCMYMYMYVGGSRLSHMHIHACRVDWPKGGKINTNEVIYIALASLTSYQGE